MYWVNKHFRLTLDTSLSFIYIYMCVTEWTLSSAGAPEGDADCEHAGRLSEDHQEHHERLVA